MGNFLNDLKPKQREAFLAEAQRRVARLDKNGDGKIDSGERNQAVESTRKVETQRSRVDGFEVRYTDVESWTQRELVGDFDANKDGFVTKEELAEKAAEARSKEGWFARTFDTDAVSPETLMKGYERESAQSKTNATRVVREVAQPLMDAAKALVARFDRNGDGAVDASERENESARSTSLERTRLDGLTVREDQVESWAVRRFLASDPNGDGKVSVDELAKELSGKHPGSTWEQASSASSAANALSTSTPMRRTLNTRVVGDVASPLRNEARDLMNRFDRNRNGEISPSERIRERLESTRTERTRINDDYVRHTEIETWLVDRMTSSVGSYVTEEDLIREAARRWPNVNWESNSEARYRFNQLWDQTRETRTGSSRQVYDPLPRPTPPSVEPDRPRPPGGSDRPTPPSVSDRPTPPSGDRPRPPGSSDRPTPPGGSDRPTPPSGERPRPPGI